MKVNSILPLEVAENYKLLSPSARVVLPDNQEVDFRKITPEEADQLSRRFPDLLQRKVVRKASTPAQK